MTALYPHDQIQKEGRSRENYNVYELTIPVDLIFTPKNPSHSVSRYGTSYQKLPQPKQHGTTSCLGIPKRTYNMLPWMKGVVLDQGQQSWFLSIDSNFH